jgi:hypothetical protein
VVDDGRESWSGLTGVWPHGHSGERKLSASWAKREDMMEKLPEGFDGWHGARVRPAMVLNGGGKTHLVHGA